MAKDNTLRGYEPVIGLEIHAQLKTNTKLFCGCSTAFGAEPNTQVCPVCLGMPGVLPVLNKRAVEYAVMMGLATESTVNLKSVFSRKNYFYPDLPKGLPDIPVRPAYLRARKARYRGRRGHKDDRHHPHTYGRGRGQTAPRRRGRKTRALASSI